MQAVVNNSSSKLNFAVILGSVREGRHGIKVANFLVNKLNAKGWNTTLIDPKVYKFPLFEKPLHHYKPGEQVPELLTTVSNLLKKADGFVIVTAEYNHMIPPALTNLMNHFHKNEYGYKPSAIACYSMGPFGWVRAAMVARQFLAELQTPSIPTIFPVSSVAQAIDENGIALDKNYDDRVQNFLNELEWYTKAYKAAREAPK